MVERVSTAFEKLTPREREILRLIAAHLQSKEIARALGLSPKTVEMHVLSARRRLSGMSRRDAALAFVAWEGGDPSSDYRKRPDGLAELSATSLPDWEIGNDDEPASFGGISDQRTNRTGPFHGELGFAEGGGNAARRNGEAKREGLLPGGAGQLRAAFQDLVAAPGDDVSHKQSTGRRDWRHELTNLQWLGLVLGITALTAVLLAVIAIGVHEFILAIQHITHR